MTCEVPPWEQPQPMNVYPVTTVEKGEAVLSEAGAPCEVPLYEQPQTQHTYPVVVDSYRTPTLASGTYPVGRLYEVIDGIPGTIRASITAEEVPQGRLSLIGGPVGRIKVLD